MFSDRASSDRAGGCHEAGTFEGNVDARRFRTCSEEGERDLSVKRGGWLRPLADSHTAVLELLGYDCKRLG